LVTTEKRIQYEWTVEQKARLLAAASQLSGEHLPYLGQKGVRLADFERWRLTQEDEGQEPSRPSRLNASAGSRGGSLERRRLSRRQPLFWC
jgi:hypothetical protein